MDLKFLLSLLAVLPSLAAQSVNFAILYVEPGAFISEYFAGVWNAAGQQTKTPISVATAGGCFSACAEVFTSSNTGGWVIGWGFNFYGTYFYNGPTGQTNGANLGGSVSSFLWLNSSTNIGVVDIASSTEDSFSYTFLSFTPSTTKSTPLLGPVKLAENEAFGSFVMVGSNIYSVWDTRGTPNQWFLTDLSGNGLNTTIRGTPAQAEPVSAFPASPSSILVLYQSYGASSSTPSYGLLLLAFTAQSASVIKQVSLPTPVNCGAVLGNVFYVSECWLGTLTSTNADEDGTIYAFSTSNLNSISNTTIKTPGPFAGFSAYYST